MFTEVFRRLLIPLFTTIEADLDDSQLTANRPSPNNPVINPGELEEAHAYSNLLGINWISSNVVIHKGYFSFLRWYWMSNISKIELKSIDLEPLILDEISSLFDQDEKVQVYRGELTLIVTVLTRVHWFLGDPEERIKDINISNVEIKLTFRRDGRNSELSCYSKPPLDDDELICAEITGDLDENLYGADFLDLKGKSNSPVLISSDLSQIETVQFNSREVHLKIS